MQNDKISRDAKSVYALLQSYTGDDGICFPSQETMAQNLSCTRMSIIRWVEELEKAGLVKVYRDLGEVNKYEPLVPDVTEELQGCNTGDTPVSLPGDTTINNTTNTTNNSVDAGEKKPRKKRDRPPLPERVAVTFDFTTRKWVNLTGDMVELWQYAYPDVNVEQQLGEMVSWLLANPEKRKDRYERFIDGWLRRQQSGTRWKPKQ
jgi:hypothetical protein